MECLIKDMPLELKARGHPGGKVGHITLKSCGKKLIVAVRDAPARYRSGKVVPESPAKGVSQSERAAEEAGEIVREFARVTNERVGTTRRSICSAMTP